MSNKIDITKDAQAVKDLVDKVNRVAILLPATANRDGLAAGLALYLSLTEMGKSVTIAYPQPTIVAWRHLVGINKLKQQIGSNNFIISLDYQDGAIEKVSYNIENNKFNLVIEQRPGSKPFDEKNVSYNYSGFAVDLIITVAASSLDVLGNNYTENKNLFKEKSVIAIGTQSPTPFGKVNLFHPVSSHSEVVAALIKSAQLALNADIATNLYDGIYAGSSNLTAPNLSADTFDTLAWLMRSGAKQTPRISEEIPQKERALSRPPEGKQTPPDWLKPKIYKSSSMLS